MWRWARRREQWSWEKMSGPAHACPCMFLHVFCACVWMSPFSRVIKDPIRSTRQTPLNPCRGIKQWCPVPPSSHSTSFVFHFCLRIISFSLFLSIYRSISFNIYFFASLFGCSDRYGQNPPMFLVCKIMWGSLVELLEYQAAHDSVFSLFLLFFISTQKVTARAPVLIVFKWSTRLHLMSPACLLI